MLTSNSLFIFFSYALVFSSIMVIIAQHPVFSLLFLVSCFIFSSFLLFLLECEFLAFLFIVVYVGAIAILFLFAIMMLESKLNNLSKNTIKYFPIGVLFSIVLLLPILNVVNTFFVDSSTVSDSFYVNNYQNWYDLIDSTYDVNVYGQILYSYFALQLLIAGLILLVVLIGVVSLTNSYEKQTRQQSTFRQLSRTVKIF
uniref:NADH dehydrogenase subunit 6 n=1 Tax=Gomphonema parvulum TaxID=97227 RepID=UPI0021FF312D|nr:NADH dehydrogenase subunit 6 [Gomphonema parvulum]UXX44711.1 NADH dehydrogenase subunit 6 [Gomphonema parvulum]